MGTVSESGRGGSNGEERVPTTPLLYYIYIIIGKVTMRYRNRDLGGS